MKEITKMEILNIGELEIVAGGISSPFTLGPAYEPTTTDEPGDGGVTYTW